MDTSMSLFVSLPLSKKRRGSTEPSGTGNKRARASTVSCPSPKDYTMYTHILQSLRFQKILVSVNDIQYLEMKGGYDRVWVSLDREIREYVDPRGLNHVMNDYGDIQKANQWLALYLFQCG